MRRIIGLAAGPLAILLAGGIVWSSSNAAFTATTRNAGNSWSSGHVVLTDDDNGVAGFTVENIVPGQSGEKCLVVTSGSNVPGEVRAYVQNLSTSGPGLENYIKFKVEKGTGGSFNDCTGFIPDAGALPAQSLVTLSQVNKDFATGGAIWTTAGTSGEKKVYRGTWNFDTTGLTQQQVDALQGARTSIDLVWELQTETTPTP
jgi:hypothetical protein